jgi:hypothetical protein
LLTTFEGQWVAGQKSVLVAGAEGGLVIRGVGIVARVGATGQTGPTTAKPVAVGAGIELGRLHLDYAYTVYTAPQTARHRIGIRWIP